MVALLVWVGDGKAMASKRTQEMFCSSSPMGAMDWGTVCLLLEVPGLSFTRACANMHELSGDRESVQIHVSGKATKMKGV